MIENILVRKNCGAKLKITVKSLVSASLIALAVILPQLVHLAAGASGGAEWLPMYLPVLLGGCILGTVWGLGVGVLSPVASFAITALFGNPMPAAARLPFMMAELATMAAISGLFADRIAKNGWTAFAAVILAFAAGRTLFMILALVFAPLTPFTPALVWSQIESGLLGMTLQCVLVPFAVMGLRKLSA